MTSRNYSRFELVTKNIPELIQISERKFQRTWSIILETMISSTLDLSSVSQKLSYEGFEVVLTTSDNRLLKVLVTTNSSDKDYLFLTTCNLFAEINLLVGEISAIQEKARNNWFPWLAGRSNQDIKLSRWIRREFQVGLRHNNQEGLSFFGVHEVNEILRHGAKITSIEPGGAITRNVSDIGGSSNFEISGFFVIIKLEEYPSSLASK